MREILFRGKCNEVGKYNGQWIEGFYGEDDGKPIIARSTDHGLIGYFCEPDSIGQYTGLTDKNGKKIFEGDIVFFYCSDVTAVVKYGQYVDYDSPNKPANGFYVEYQEDSKTIQESVDSRESDEEYGCEVIGNIHDNPELMKGE